LSNVGERCCHGVEGQFAGVCETEGRVVNIGVDTSGVSLVWVRRMKLHAVFS
jgi:hypothetical protein